jgi:hypothetical protein
MLADEPTNAIDDSASFIVFTFILNDSLFFRLLRLRSSLIEPDFVSEEFVGLYVSSGDEHKSSSLSSSFSTLIKN